MDSVYSLGDHLVAIKCVGLGRIIVFSADFNHGASGETQVEVEPLLEFAWKKTDQFFMNIGGVSSLGLVACGDNLGDIWVNKVPPPGSYLSASDGPLRVAPLGKQSESLNLLTSRYQEYCPGLTWSTRRETSRWRDQ